MSVGRKNVAGSVVAALVALSLAAMTSMATSAAAAASIVRFQGADRFATSAAIVHASYSPGVPVVYIATGLNFPDALAGGAAAAKAGGPLLLVLPDLIPTQISAELTRLTPASIVVLGGTGAVSDAVLTSLQTYTSGSVTRVFGADRYTTAANLAASFPTGSPVFIATGRDFPDALAGTAAAAAQHAAILLTTPTTIPSGTAAALSALAPSSITILGGTGAVSSAVATQLGTYTPTVTRLSGSDRYATAAAIATSAFPSATGVFITTGVGFADALTGGPVAGTTGQPLLLATVTCLPTPTAAVVAADAPTTVTLLGGTGVLGAGVESLTTCAPPPGPTGLRSVSAWETLFLQHWSADDVNVYRPLSLSGDSWDMYNLAFGIDANTAMYRATGETRYLDRSLLYIHNVISTARLSSSFGSAAFQDGYLGWVTQRKLPAPDLTGQEVPLFESFMWRYVTEALLVIRQTPALYTNPTYKNQYDSILAFTEVNIFDKWYNRGTPHCVCGGAGNPNIYRQNTNMASHWAFISLLLSKMTQGPTRQARCVTVYTNIDQHMPNYSSSLRQQFQANPVVPVAYVWDSAWGPYTGAGGPSVQDVPHGSGEVSYIIEAYGLGVAWTAADITALSHTLTDLIWKTSGVYPANVDGSGPGNGVVFDGFMKLGRYSPAIQRSLENYSGAIADNYGAVGAFYANGALNAKFLGA